MAGPKDNNGEVNLQGILDSEQPKQKTPEATVTPITAPLNDIHLDGVLDSEQPVAEAGAPTPPAYDFRQAWLDHMEPNLQNISDRFGAGTDGIARNFAGMSVINGQKTYEQVMQELTPSEAQVQRDSRMKQYDSMGIKDLGHAANAIGPFVQMIPMLGAIGQRAAASAGVGAAIGAIPNPLEALTVTTGAAAGGFIGATSALTELGAGGALLEAKAAGLSDNTAKGLAITAGMINGGIGMLQGATAGKVGVDAAKEALKGPVGQKMLQGMISYAKNVGIQGGLGAAQKAADEALLTIGALIDNKHGIIPTPKQILKEVVEAGWEAVRAAAVAVPVMHGAGKAAGNALKQVRELSHAEASKVVNAKLIKLPAKLDKEMRESLQPNLSPDQALQGAIQDSVPPEEKVKEAEAERVSAKDEAKALGDQVRALKDAGQEVPAELTKQYRDARKRQSAAIKKRKAATLALAQESAKEINDRIEALKADVAHYEEKRQEYREGSKLVPERLQETIQHSELQLRYWRQQERATGEAQYKTYADGLEKDIEGYKKRRADLLKGKSVSLPFRLKEELNNAKQELQGWIEIAKDINKKAEKLETADLKEARKDLASVLKRIKTRKAGKKRESPTDFDSAQVLHTYKTLIEDELSTNPEGKAGYILFDQFTKEAEDAKLRDANAEGDQAITPPLDQSLDAIIAGDVLGLKHKTAEEVRALTAKLERIDDTGRDKRLNQKLEQKNKNIEIRNRTEKYVNGAKPMFVRTVDKNGKEVLKQSKVTEGARRLGAHGELFSGWSELLKNIFLDEKDRKGVNDLIDEIDTHDQVQQAQTDIREQSDKAVDTISGGDEKQTKLMAEVVQDGHKKNDLGQYVNQKGAHENLVISDDELIRLYGMIKNKRRQVGLSVGLKTRGEDGRLEVISKEGITFDDNEKNIYKLGAGEMSAESLVNQRMAEKGLVGIAENIGKFYDQYFDRVNEVHIDAYALPLDKMPDGTYEGHASRESAADPGTHSDLLNSFNDRRRTLIPGSILEDAPDYKKAYVLEGGLQGVFRYIQQNENFRNFRHIDNTLRYTFSYGPIREVISHKLSAQTTRIMDTSYQTTVGTRGVQYEGQNKLVARLRARQAAFYTGGKIVNSLGQLTSVLNVLQDPDIGVIDFTKWYLDYWRDPLAAVRELKDTNYMKNRAGNMITEYTERKERQGLVGAANHPGTVGFFQGAITAMDRWANYMGGWIVFKTAMEKGATREQAIAKFERVMNRTQSSSTPDQMTHFEKGGDIQKGMMLFQKQNTQTYILQMSALKLAAAQPKASYLMLAAKSIFAAHVAQAAFTLTISSPTLIFGDNEEQRKAAARVERSLIIGPALPILGDVANNALVVGLTNPQFGLHETPTQATTLALRPVDKAVDMLRLQVKAATKGDLDLHDQFTYLKDLAEVMTLTPVGGVPTLPALNAAQVVAGASHAPKGNHKKVIME